mmetsp:Transcript_39051/g.125544  ORF Transcript_39051/g.125544 Transcript_39051/m.125544 type:complete len:373 (+) Transcript_39051:761-1879(+)
MRSHLHNAELSNQEHHSRKCCKLSDLVQTDGHAQTHEAGEVAKDCRPRGFWPIEQRHQNVAARACQCSKHQPTAQHRRPARAQRTKSRNPKPRHAPDQRKIEEYVHQVGDEHAENNRAEHPNGLEGLPQDDECQGWQHGEDLHDGVVGGQRKQRCRLPQRSQARPAHEQHRRQNHRVGHGEHKAIHQGGADAVIVPGTGRLADHAVEGHEEALPQHHPKQLPPISECDACQGVRADSAHHHRVHSPHGHHAQLHDANGQREPRQSDELQKRSWGRPCARPRRARPPSPLSAPTSAAPRPAKPGTIAAAPSSGGPTPRDGGRRAAGGRCASRSALRSAEPDSLHLSVGGNPTKVWVWQAERRKATSPLPIGEA